ncbi:MAG TPA: NIPSNAP family protein [Bryobacteraceae bacterium]|nr:NIPSNAP family protein [Bryobacteraceae bacterium]
MTVYGVLFLNSATPSPGLIKTPMGEWGMKRTSKLGLAVLNGLKFKGGMFCGVALLSFAAGAILTARLMHLEHVRADSNRVFELMVYHTIPGKVPALESVFRDVSKLQDKHDLNVIGYWVPSDDPAWSNTFVYLVAHRSQEDAKKNWAALHADPAFPEYRKQAALLLEKVGEDYKVDEVFMRPTDFSAMK